MNTEGQVKDIIVKHNGSARKQQIARELKMGLDYVDLVCRDLERKGEIIFLDGLYSFTTADDKSHQRKSSSLHSREQKSIPSTYTKSTFSDIPEMTQEVRSVLEDAGYKTIEALADAPIMRLMQETKLTLHEAAKLTNRAREVLNKIGE